jgi:beta-glucosidase
MQEIGIRGYRFSIAWTRVLPDGRGQVNQAGLDFYSRLVDALLEARITSFVPLYHWDLPQRLEDEGG